MLLRTKIIISIFPFVLLLGAVYFFVLPIVVIRQPWRDIKINATEDAFDQKTRQELELNFKQITSGAINKKDVTTCKQLPETARSFVRDGKGEIDYISSGTFGPLSPHRQSALPRNQCVVAYAISFVDPQVCRRYIVNESLQMKCLIEVVTEMTAQGAGDSKKVCSSISEKYRDYKRDCLYIIDTVKNVSSIKTEFIDEIRWEV